MALQTTTSWFYFELFSYILWILMIAYAIYSTIKTKLNNYNATTWMKKRNIIVFYSLNASCICCMSSLMFTGICWANTSGLILNISNIAWVCAIFIWMSVLLTKNWGIYYRYKWTQYIQQSQWQQIINPSIIKNENIINWFIRNNSTYGQTKYIHKLFVSIATCCCVVLAFIWFFTSVLFHPAIHIMISCVSTLLLFIPPVMLYVFLVWKTPVLDDIFCIHWESKIHAKLLCSTIPGPPISTLYFIVTLDGRALLVASLLSSVAIFFMVFVSTVYIPNKLNSPPNPLTMDAVMNNSSKLITLEMVLCNDATLNLFMNYLSSEYSMEILLCSIEIMQYQNYLKPLIDNLEPLSDVKQVKLPETCPISEIIVSNDPNSISKSPRNSHNLLFAKNNDIGSAAKKMAHELYLKYIRELAEFEVNISYPMRVGLSEKLEDLTELLSDDSIHFADLYLLFEECKQEMLHLQSISFQRFRLETEFEIVKSVFFLAITFYL
eukprot:595491_1